MPAIPTPFVGGGLEGSGRGSSPPLAWAAPYWPAPERETVETAEAGTPEAGMSEAAAPEAGRSGAGVAEAAAAAAAAPATEESLESEGEPDEPVAHEIEPYAPSGQELEAPAPAASAGPHDAGGVETDAVDTTGESGVETDADAEDDFDYPDYLFGPDADGEAAGDDAEDADTSVETEPAAGRAEIEAVIRRLLEGPDGDRIRRLAAELDGLTPEEAVARAFAAGYLSGRAETSDD